MRWSLSTDQQPLSLSQLQQLLLSNRGITDPQAQKAFFSPAHPTTFEAEAVGISSEQMKLAVARIQQAKQNQDKIVIFGDYDADGISATAVLWQALHAYGCQVMPFIPDRQRHGYGLSKAGVDEILSQGKPDLIITVDNGIVAFEPLEYAQAAGIEVLVTDHHAPEKNLDGSQKLPPAVAVVHTTQLCGTTVAWMLGQSVVMTMPESSSAEVILKEKVQAVVVAGLDLCGIATIADQVTLTHANRSFAYHGVFALRQSKRPGLLALLEMGSTAQADLDTTTINFVLAPRINAMGRLAHGLEALRLLCTTSQAKARELAVTLHQTNTDRQELTADLVELAITQAEERKKSITGELNIIVVASDVFHEGVVGLVAGKLVEVFNRPAIAISLRGETGKASARSVPGVNIIELIRQVKDDLLEAGGHPMAAGFGVAVSKLDRVRERLESLALAQITAEQLEPVLMIDCPLPYALATKKTAKMITQFAPFGKGNLEPLFVFDHYLLSDLQTMGKEYRHLRFKMVPMADLGAQPLSGVGWGMGSQLAELQALAIEGQPVSVAGKLAINAWKDKEYLQVVVEGIVSTKKE